DVLHRVERLARRPAAGFVDADDRRVLQPRREPRLALEADPEALVDELLDRHRAAQATVARADDPAHAAPTGLRAPPAALPPRAPHVVLGGNGGQLGEVALRLGGAGDGVDDVGRGEATRQAQAVLAGREVREERLLVIVGNRPSDARGEEELDLVAAPARRGPG